MDTTLFLFDTTTAAMWAEEVAAEEGIPAEVVPAPADADAKCDLALRVRAADRTRMAGTMEREGIDYVVHGGA